MARRELGPTSVRQVAALASLERLGGTWRWLEDEQRVEVAAPEWAMKEVFPAAAARHMATSEDPVDREAWKRLRLDVGSAMLEALMTTLEKDPDVQLRVPDEVIDSAVHSALEKFPGVRPEEF